MSEEEGRVLREGGALADARLEALRGFTVRMLESRGHVSASEWADFLEAGWSRRAGLEVIQGIAVKVMSNYTNALVGVPLEESTQEK